MTLKVNKSWNPFHVQEFTALQLNWLLSMYFSDVHIVGQDLINSKKPWNKPSSETLSGSPRSALFHAKEILKICTPSPVKHASGNFLRKVFSSQPYSINDVIFSPVQMSSCGTNEAPFGLIAICKP